MDLQREKDLLSENQVADLFGLLIDMLGEPALSITEDEVREIGVALLQATLVVIESRK